MGWERVHLTGMGLSYVALITGFYVDSGPHLPGWRHLPGWAFWILPATIGAPLTGWALWKRTREEAR